MHSSVKTFLSSLTSILTPGNADAAPKAPDPHAMVMIQKSMLRLLGEKGARLNPQLEHRIRYAQNIESLWFLRADLAQALCLQIDETNALQAVADLTPLFEGNIPKTQLQAYQRGQRRSRY
ncbi:hypothetical protein [Hydrogenophaga sp.]|uniref:hypothetical protein n=1 Tax=Hydrogenophaga sp. TaxID=1904254 RepID=UPI002634DB07|nr:hypothetical protein [Hydrogenophaga sp.]MCW5655326.1 hypothetical protein [Hydrogenophaga sp.]